LVSANYSRRRGEYRNDWDCYAPCPKIELQDGMYDHYPNRQDSNNAFETWRQNDGKQRPNPLNPQYVASRTFSHRGSFVKFNP
jgi:hypothetical protein